MSRNKHHFSADCGSNIELYWLERADIYLTSKCRLYQFSLKSSFKTTIKDTNESAVKNARHHYPASRMSSTLPHYRLSFIQRSRSGMLSVSSSRPYSSAMYLNSRGSVIVLNVLGVWSALFQLLVQPMLRKHDLVDKLSSVVQSSSQRCWLVLLVRQYLHDAIREAITSSTMRPKP